MARRRVTPDTPDPLAELAVRRRVRRVYAHDGEAGLRVLAAELRVPVGRLIEWAEQDRGR